MNNKRYNFFVFLRNIDILILDRVCVYFNINYICILLIFILLMILIFSDVIYLYKNKFIFGYDFLGFLFFIIMGSVV